MNHLEIEYKTLLTEKEYQILLADFADVTPVEQTNYYIDTPDEQIKKSRSSLRIRILENRAELTLKVPQEIGNLEYNQELSIETAQHLVQHFILPDGSIKELLVEKNIDLDKLIVWGHLTTKRLEKESEIGLMALDANRCSHHKDFELEVEVSDAPAGKIAFDDYLKSKGISFKYASSKVARAASLLKTAK
ncbi:CYTH domain-containing protein [Streptococcus sp. X16XC17]|uniref:CYTH domain-containing protein n=1 Tax=unclassified Streptococcus TaxID=2608887 RepID=UPI00066FC4F0|nr:MULTISPECIES: CYTH domain-containing protein [unclassified Streptococcus]TCD46399.1 CYTH domain-containing protein [Streptococcus sp. X16XC17]